MNKTLLHLLILCVFCIPLFYINIPSSHSYGDDWAQYLKEALNIANGKPYYISNYIFNPLNIDYAPPQYPPGYPLLLAPIVKFTGTSIVPLSYLNTVFLCFLLLVSYYYFTIKTSRFNALCLSLILVYSFPLIDLKGEILSDIPCALFCLLYLGIREHTPTLTVKRFLLLSFIGAFCMLIRTQAIIIVFSEISLCLISFCNKEHKKKQRGTLNKFSGLLLSSGILLVFIILNYFIFPTTQDTLSFYANLYKNIWDKKEVWHTIGYNVNYLYQLMNEILYLKMNDSFFQAFVSIMTSISFVLVLIGFTKSMREEVSLSLVFFILMCFLIIVTPVWQGLRYFLPAVPVYLLFAVKGAGMLIPLVTKIEKSHIAAVALIIFLLLSYDGNEKLINLGNEQGIKHTDSVAFAFIKKNIEENQIVLFTKPRLLTLITNKKSMNISWHNSAVVNKQLFDSMHVGYLLYCRHLNYPIVDEILSITPKPYTDSVIINDDYTLYKLNCNHTPLTF